MDAATAAPSALAAGWTAERVDVADSCATWLASIAAELVACLDTAHGAGVFVPPRVAESAASLHALERSWRANAAGRPADAGDKATLGLA